MAERQETKPRNPFTRIPLEILLLAERVIEARAGGRATPVPTKVKVPLGILAAVGVLGVTYFFSKPMIDYQMTPLLADACNQPSRLMVYGDSSNPFGDLLARFEPPVVSAAPLTGGGGLLDANNRISISHKIAIYNDTALPILTQADYIRDALNHESLGMDIPPGVNSILVFYQSRAATPELRRAYFSGMIPRITAEVEAYRYSLGSPWGFQERLIIGGVELTTLFGETLDHPGLRLQEEFREQFSRRIALGVRQAAIDGLRSANMYGRSIPPNLSRGAQEHLLQGTSVYSLNSGFTQQACDYVRTRRSPRVGV